MNNTTTYRSLGNLAALLTSAVLMAGCANQRGEKFVSDSDARSIGRFDEAQCAAGAKEDAMLYDMNFHGDQLNSLGQGKLDLILKGTPSGDIVLVYLNMPHEQVAVRQVAVNSYLKSAGVSEDKIVVAEGPNLNQMHPSAYNLHHVYKKDGEIFDGEHAKDDAAPGAAAAAH
jgi:hypothetical protein